MSDEAYKPRDPRIRTRFEALYSMGRCEGAGVLADISYSGAHVEDTSLVPEVGGAISPTSAKALSASALVASFISPAEAKSR